MPEPTRDLGQQRGDGEPQEGIDDRSAQTLAEGRLVEQKREHHAFYSAQDRAIYRILLCRDPGRGVMSSLHSGSRFAWYWLDLRHISRHRPFTTWSMNRRS